MSILLFNASQRIDCNFSRCHQMADIMHQIFFEVLGLILYFFFIYCVAQTFYIQPILYQILNLFLACEPK